MADFVGKNQLLNSFHSFCGLSTDVSMCVHVSVNVSVNSACGSLVTYTHMRDMGVSAYSEL